MWVGPPAIRRARRADLYDYLLKNHSSRVIQAGDSLRLCCNHSVSIKKGYSGYTDFADLSTGNAIDCLMNFFDYDFQDAAAELAIFDGVPEEDLGLDEDLGLSDEDLEDTSTTTSQTNFQTTPPAAQRTTRPSPPPPPPKPFVSPAPVQGPYRQLFAYLTQQRGIPDWLVHQLIDWGMIYQEAGHNNIVFINPSHTYAELRGTLSGKPFHGMAPGSDQTLFWWFKPLGPDSVPTAIYICEAAIDAISLHLCRQHLPLAAGDNPMYCSIGGVANQQRIDRIKVIAASMGIQTILAVDNDPAGEKCRQRNPDCFSVVPRGKDWNEDWLDSGGTT